MAHIYMDESGCLGFDFTKRGTSRHFVITFLFSTQKRRLDKIVKKTFQSMPARVRRAHNGVLHCNNEKPALRMKVLQLLAAEETASIMAIRLNKEKVYASLQNEKTVLYNYVTNILLDRIFTRKLVPLDEPLHLIASRRETNKFLNHNFQAYLEQQTTKNHKLALDVSILPPHAEKGLQVVDFASWAIFRSYERGDSSYYDVIRNKVAEDKSLFG
jgi:hypothetical protein